MSEAQIRHVYEQWHKTLVSQDLAGLVSLYAEHAVFESPTVLAQFPDRDDGILRGRGEIEKLFARNFANLKTEFSELYRSGLFFSNGRLLTTRGVQPDISTAFFRTASSRASRTLARRKATGSRPLMAANSSMNISAETALK